MGISVIFKITGIGICIALLNQILIKAGKEEMAMMTTLAGVIIVLVIIVKMLAEFFETIKVFMEFLIYGDCKNRALALCAVILIVLVKITSRNSGSLPRSDAVFLILYFLTDSLKYAFSYISGLYERLDCGKGYFPHHYQSAGSRILRNSLPSSAEIPGRIPLPQKWSLPEKLSFSVLLYRYLFRF